MKLRFYFVGILTAGVNSDRAALANELPTTASQSKAKIRIQPTRQPLSTTTTSGTSESPKTMATMTSLQGGGIDNSSQEEECRGRFPFLETLRRNYSHQPVFLQAVEEMAINLKPLFADPTHGEFYQRAFLVMTEPERTISFRVPWEDDEGNMRYNRGWRVEFNR